METGKKIAVCAEYQYFREVKNPPKCRMLGRTDFFACTPEESTVTEKICSEPKADLYQATEDLRSKLPAFVKFSERGSEKPGVVRTVRLCGLIHANRFVRQVTTTGADGSGETLSLKTREKAEVCVEDTTPEGAEKKLEETFRDFARRHCWWEYADSELQKVADKKKSEPDKTDAYEYFDGGF